MSADDGRITSYNVCYTKLLRSPACDEIVPRAAVHNVRAEQRLHDLTARDMMLRRVAGVGVFHGGIRSAGERNNFV